MTRDDLLAQVATDLDRLMCARSLTQDGLAVSSGVCRVTVNQILKTVREPRVGTLHRMARAMGYRVEVRFIPDP